jgi:LCP family protein required for cell wall assembly
MNNLLDKKQDNYLTKKIKKKPPSAASSFLKSFSLSFFIMCAIAIVLYWGDVKNLAVDLMRLATNKSTARFEFSLPFSAKRQNILLLGVDVSDSKKDPFKGVRSDSISIVSIAPYAKDINIISVPRDSKVYHSNASRPDKINHAFAHGGVDLTISTIEETFGIRINHYLVLSNKAFVSFIDDIGGLPIYVEKDMHYGDNSAGLHINLTKGEHVLSGNQAEGYMRFRKDSLGDIGRISRQQWFFNAMAKQVSKPEVLIKLPGAIKNSSHYIQTDMSIYQLTQFAGLLKTTDPSQIHFVTVPGAPSSRDSISYWILDPDKTQDMVDRLIYRDKPKPLDAPLSVGILYKGKNTEEAEKLKASLEETGLKVKMRDRETLNRNQISVHNLNVPIDVIYSLKKEFPETRELQIVYDLVGFNKVGDDFTVIFGN